MDVPDLRDLNAFAAVARHRSFRRAARELRVSVSGLSQRLRELEARLGVRLLNRTTRSVAPTQAGELLLSRITPALGTIADAVGTVRGLGDTPSGRLRINAPLPAAQLVLAPMVAPFLKRHPAIELDIVVESSLIDIVAQGFDAGVRYEEHLAQDMIAVPLGPPQRYAVVGSPEFVARVGRPTHPKDLLRHPCLSIVFRSGAMAPWEFEKAGRSVRLLPKGPFTTSDMRVLLQAALDGLGFIGAFEEYVREDIKAGALVTVLDDWCPEFPGPLLYYPSRRQPPPALSAFIAFVKEWRAERARTAKPLAARTSRAPARWRRPG
jgi:DNA-binding transcriptional LysR family regulator